MKRILILVLLSVITFSSFFDISNALIFDPNPSPTSPYCNKEGECGLKAGIDLLKDLLLPPIITEGTASAYIQNVIAYLLRFLYIVATIIIIYAGFVMLTAAGNEERFKKGKTIITYAIIGVVIIFLAGSIVRFVFDTFENAKQEQQLQNSPNS